MKHAASPQRIKPGPTTRSDTYDQSRITAGPWTRRALRSMAFVRGAASICSAKKAAAPRRAMPSCPYRASTTAPTLIQPVCSGMFQNHPCSKDSMKMLVSSGSGSRSRALVVAVDGQVAEVRVDPAEAERPADEAGLAAGVHDVPGLEPLLPPVFVREAHADGAVAFEQHAQHAAPLADLGSRRRGVLEEHLVEGRPPHLVGVGKVLVGLAEVPAPGLGRGAPDHRGAPLLEVALGLEPGEHAQRVQDGHRRGEQRLADVVAGKPLPFQERHGQALSGQEGRRRRARRSSPDDDDVRPAHPPVVTLTARRGSDRASCSWPGRCRRARAGPAPWPSRGTRG